ncbi:TPA: SMI1/KNR4 family protein [Vibrio parahaemolyticus]
MTFPIDEKYIVEFESELGLQLPENYKNGLLCSNGGEVVTSSDVWQLFPVFDKSNRKRVTRTANHILVETKSANEWGGFPCTAVAIASNGMGDLAILVPEQENAGQLKDIVYRWHHETGDVTILCPTSEIWFNSLA